MVVAPTTSGATFWRGSPKFEGPYGLPSDRFETVLQRTQALGEPQGQNLDAAVQTSAYTFYLDNVNLEVDYSVDPFELPLIETAQRL